MATRVEELYDEDFHAWAMGQADALRRLADLRPNTGIDFAHLIEEFEAWPGPTRRRQGAGGCR